MHSMLNAPPSQYLSGVGKTSIVARLAGTTDLNSNYCETNGIKKTNVFWPVKIWDKVVLFKLQFWDTSEFSIKKYSHILPACRDKTDAICCVFSFDDITSFNDVPYLMNTMSAIKEKPATIVIGTKFKPWSSSTVQDIQVKEFEEKWKLKVIKIDANKSSPKNETIHCSYQLNEICNILWNRDKEYLSKQLGQV
ncbi:ciliogenesis and planar polarity effector 2-like isoform X2 [Prorops nasuta]|uniref:ciliogenesis and planar polarity effector 2-like isoform X2 n=1 Tax=Prorops nasuta TaxID=863751 RepID=UPI0034CFC7EF